MKKMIIGNCDVNTNSRVLFKRWEKVEHQVEAAKPHCDQNSRCKELYQENPGNEINIRKFSQQQKGTQSVHYPERLHKWDHFTQQQQHQQTPSLYIRVFLKWHFVKKNVQCTYETNALMRPI